MHSAGRSPSPRFRSLAAAFALLAVGACARGEIGDGEFDPVAESPQPAAPGAFENPDEAPRGGLPVPRPSAPDAARLDAARLDEEPRADATVSSPPAAREDAGVVDGPASLADAGGADAAAANTGACDVEISEVALYQGVKVTLARNGAPVAMFNAPVVQKRPALVRAYVRPSAAFIGREAELRLVLRSGAGEKVLSEKKPVKAASDDATAASTFNFVVPAAELAADTTWVVEVVSPAGCGAAGRAPGTGAAKLGAIRTGKLKVTLVPIKYDADGSGRLPDTSDAQLKRLRDYVMAMFPVEAVETSMHAAVSSTIALTDPNNWPRMLDQVRLLRAQDAPATDVYYYALVNPANTGGEYCKGTCVTGIAYRGGNTADAQRAGLGIGFTGNAAAETMAHELGHEHGRLHAPCGDVKGPDPAFPGGAGNVLVQGYNILTGQLIPAMGRKDIMGYCNPKWISDYTFGALAARSTAVNGVIVAKLELGAAAERSFRALLVDGDGHVGWGLPAGEPFGEPERARVLDARGVLVTTVTVYRTAIPDSDHATVLVPAPRDGWDAIEVSGSPPLRFAAPALVEPLGR